MVTGEATGKMNSISDTLGSVNNESLVVGCDLRYQKVWWMVSCVYTLYYCVAVYNAYSLYAS